MQADLLDTVRLSNQSLRLMVAMLNEAGIDPLPRFAAAGIDPVVAEDPLAEISGAQELHFQQAFAEATAHIPGLWMRTGLRYRLMSYGPLGFAVLAAANVTEGLRVLRAFQALTFSLMHYDVEEEHGTAVALAADDSRAPDSLREFLQERALGSVTMFLNDMRMQRFPLLRIESRLRRPQNWQGCDALLGTPVHFGAASTRWVFAPGAASEPLPMASPLLEDSYQRLCRKLVETDAHPDPFPNRVYEVLVRAGRGFPSAIATAEQLGMSERGLHRHLEARGTSFGQMLDNVRCERAKELLDHSTLPIDQISEMLGFAEAASFSRAFKRWTGVAPSSHRRRNG